nr:acyl-CoA dehydrogenase family protein [Bradyrhizobium sp. 160]
MEALLDRALAATNDRRHGHHLWFENRRFSGLQWLLADVATDLHAARLLFSAVASKLDRGERASVDAAHAKSSSREPQ